MPVKLPSSEIILLTGVLQHLARLYGGKTDLSKAGNESSVFKLKTFRREPEKDKGFRFPSSGQRTQHPSLESLHSKNNLPHIFRKLPVLFGIDIYRFELADDVYIWFTADSAAVFSQ